MSSQHGRKSKIDIQELRRVFNSSHDEMEYYLDAETGNITFITEQTRRQYEEIGIDNEDLVALRDVIQQQNITAWEKQALIEAGKVDASLGTRYLAIPSTNSYEGYEDMEDFISTVKGVHLREKLEIAIQGAGAFRRFSDVLLGHPAERKRWFAFKDKRTDQRVMKWLESEGIDVIS